MPSPGTPVDTALVRLVVENGFRQYFSDRRGRVRFFVDHNFNARGTGRLHRAALGADIMRAPANLLLAGPHAALKGAAAAARALGAPRLGQRLDTTPVLLRTDVARRIEWLICTELLELPCRQGKREFRGDALAETILKEALATGVAIEMLAAIGQHSADPAFRTKLGEAMASYAGTRAAAAEITTSLLTLSAGALAVKQLTPGAVSLGPALAGILAQQAAIASFPLGAGLGSIWYGFFPAAPSLLMMAGLTGGLMLAAACTAAFAGLLADPLQRRLGLHERRLHRLLKALERQMLDPTAPAYAVHDHYVARVLDLFDLLGSAYRLAHGPG